jgi:F-box protein 21
MKYLTDELIRGCREYLMRQQIPFDPQEAGYDNTKVSQLICAFMQSVGFGHCQREAVMAQASFQSYLNLGSDYSNPLVHLPHSYLTTHKRTIPISLVHIFVTIARGLGLQASPIPFPHRVLAHVAAPNPNEKDIYVDVFDAAILSAEGELTVLMAANGIAPVDMTAYITPCGAREMLLRSARNMMSSLQHETPPRPTEQRSTLLFCFCIYLLLGDLAGAE